MTGGEITAITLASISVVGGAAPYVAKIVMRMLGRRSACDAKIERLEDELEDVRATQARCEADRKTDRRVLRWVLDAMEARKSVPPGPLARALESLFEDETDAHGEPAE